MQTIPPEPVTDDRTGAVRRVSNARYAALKEKVLAEISRQFGPHRFKLQKGGFAPQTLPPDDESGRDGHLARQKALIEGFSLRGGGQ